MENLSESTFRETLCNTLSLFEVKLDENQVVALEKHYEMLKSWNVVHNLTTVTEQKKAINSHYVDCLLGLSFIDEQETLWDFGSGGGFPGLVAAVLWPKSKLVLVEASRKKCSFLLEASRTMHLKNVVVSNLRVEDIKKASFALSRATFSAQTATKAARGLEQGATMVVWSSETSENLEKAYEKAGLFLKKISSYEIQGLGKRKILFLIKEKAGI